MVCTTWNRKGNHFLLCAWSELFPNQQFHHNWKWCADKRRHFAPSKDLSKRFINLLWLVVLDALFRGGGTYGRTDEWTDGRTYGNSPLCPTGHRPFGAAAQKGRPQTSVPRSSLLPSVGKGGRSDVPMGRCHGRVANETGPFCVRPDASSLKRFSRRIA